MVVNIVNNNQTDCVNVTDFIIIDFYSEFINLLIMQIASTVVTEVCHACFFQIVKLCGTLFITKGSVTFLQI